MSGEVRAVGRRVLACLPPVDFAFSYGSAVVPQVGANGATHKAAMMDFILAVRDPVAWHEANLNRYPRHYSALGRLGPRAVVCVQRRGSGLYFNPLVTVTESPGLSDGSAPLPAVKYGVVAVDDLTRDLTHWNHLFAAGRLHKPVNVLTPGITNSFETDFSSLGSSSDSSGPSAAALSLLPPLRSNLRAALSAALLSLPPVFADHALWTAVTQLSYRGDVRSLLRAEAPDKVASIARGSRAPLRALYAPYLAEAGVVGVRAGQGEAQRVEALVAMLAAGAGGAGAGAAGGVEAGVEAGVGNRVEAEAALFEIALSVTAQTAGLSPAESLALAFASAPSSTSSETAADAAASPEVVLLHQLSSPTATAALIAALPAPLATVARDATAAASTGGASVGAGAGAGAGAVRAAASAAVDAQCARVVRCTSVIEMAKGLVSAGVGKSVTYAVAKLAKGLKGKGA